jgi:hypothetical protein
MVKADFDAKIDELLTKTLISTKKECERLFASGGIEPSYFKDDYVLPKIILAVALKTQAEAWKSRDANHLEMIKNLSYF